MRRMEKDDLSDLENLYVEKIQSFDEERQKFNSYTNLIKIDQRELHILQWDSRQQTENSESRSAELKKLNDELRSILRQTDEAKLELETISHNKVTNLSQIQLLSGLSQPVKHDTTYFFEDKFALVAPAGKFTGGKTNTGISLTNSKVQRVAENQMKDKPKALSLKQVNTSQLNSYFWVEVMGERWLDFSLETFYINLLHLLIILEQHTSAENRRDSANGRTP